MFSSMELKETIKDLEGEQIKVAFYQEPYSYLSYVLSLKIYLK